MDEKQKDQPQLPQKKPKNPFKGITLSERQIAQLEAFAIAGFPFELIAKHFNLSKKKLEVFLSQESGVQAMYKESMEKAVTQVASRLFRDAIHGNTTAQIFYLKTKGRWKEVDDGPPQLPGPDLTQYSYEQLFLLKHGRPPTQEEKDFMDRTENTVVITIPPKDPKQ